MVGWGHPESLAPPLRVRLDGTTLKVLINTYIYYTSIAKVKQL